MSPLSKATRKHIDDVQQKRANDLKKLRAARRKKNPTFMDKFKKGFKKESPEESVEEVRNMGKDDKSRAKNQANYLANKKIMNKHKFANKKPTKEEQEVDELNKSTMARYTRAAARDINHQGIKGNLSKIKKRVSGIDKATNKLAMRKEEVEITEAKSKAGDALMAYAKKSGGIDKRDMMTIAGKLQNYAATGNPSNKMDIAKKLKSMDTDPRDKVVEILMANDPAMGRAIMQKAGIKLREETQMDEQKLDELSPMTLRKYRAKAAADQAGGNPMTRDPKRFDKRSKGIARANKKLAGDNPFELYTSKPGWEKASKELEAAVKSKNKAKVQQLQKKYAALGARDTEANQAIRQMMGESVEHIEEKYSKSMGFKGVDDMVRRMEKVMTPTSVLCKSISRDADNVVPEFRKMEKAMKIISAQWEEINYTIDMAESVEYNEIDEINEATWYKVDVQGMPTVFMDGSPSSIKAKLRKTLKKGDMIKSVERVTPADMKKWFRDMAKSNGDFEDGPGTGKGDDDGPGIDEAFGAKKFSDKQIKMAYGIINDPRWKGGNMTSIVRRIEGIAKGLSSHPGVRAAIRRTNEDTLFDDLIAEELEFLNYVEENFDSMEVEDLEDIIEDTDEDINESDAAYARALEKEREGRLTPNDRDKLAKIRAMLSKEKRAELRRDAKK